MLYYQILLRKLYKKQKKKLRATHVTKIPGVEFGTVSPDPLSIMNEDNCIT